MTEKKWDNAGASRFSKPKRVHFCDCTQPVAGRNMWEGDPKVCVNCTHVIEEKEESDEREASHG